MASTTIQTPYGIFSGVTTMEHSPEGTLVSIRLEEQNMILTHIGALIPFYGEETVRRKHKPSVTFHPNGMIKAVALETPMAVETPIGELPAELVTFYETGELHRVFPLDGKISGCWSEEDERGLNIPLSFELGFTAFTALLSGISFYKSGQLKSVTLFPEERILVDAGVLGPIRVRCGFSLYESGALCSLEPAEPTTIITPIGALNAYDVTAHGINADNNSLLLDESGRLTALVTSGDRFTVRKADSTAPLSFEPFIPKEEDGGLLVPVPLALTFDNDRRRVTVSGSSGTAALSFDDAFFITHGIIGALPCIGDCSRCHQGCGQA